MAVWLLPSGAVSLLVPACFLKGWAGLAPSPFLPPACLPMCYLTFPITTCSTDGEGTLPSSLWAASWQSARCSQICMHLRRSWPSGLHHDGAYASSTGLMSLCNFCRQFGILHPTWTHWIFCEAFPGRLSAVASWKFLFPLVTAEGNSLLFVLSVLFCEALDTQRHGELRCWILLSPHILFHVVVFFF